MARLAAERSYDAVLVLSPFCTGVRAPVLQLLYDLYPLKYPRILPLTYAADREYWVMYTGAIIRALVARRCRTVIAISEDTASDIRKLRLNHRTEVVIAHLGSSVSTRESQELISTEVAELSTGRFLLYVGAFNVQKNVRQVVRAFETLSHRHPDLELVLVGQENWPQIHHFTSLVKKPKVHVLSGCSDSELATLYGSCCCFLYLSRYEGFGLPVLEAMSCGAPVVVSTGGALPEVVGPAGYVVPPDRVASIVEAVEAALEPSTNAMLRAQSRRRSADFSWHTMADIIATGLVDAANDPRR